MVAEPYQREENDDRTRQARVSVYSDRVDMFRLRHVATRQFHPRRVCLEAVIFNQSVGGTGIVQSGRIGLRQY
jgi:hypothetical protein